MAKRKHLNAIMQGPKAWARWREEHPGLRPDLSGADLSGINLQSLDFSSWGFGESYNDKSYQARDDSYVEFRRPLLDGIDFSDTNLSNANLKYACFEKANFVGANLSNANLFNTFLVDANFRHATLRGADLSYSLLILTNFHNADLREADLKHSYLGSTILGGTNLSKARGLGTCKHQYSSIIDHQCLEISGNLSVSFLRGCGLPDILIRSIPTFARDTIKFESCFISYSSKDQVFADYLYATLQDIGVRCWFAHEDVKIGDKFREQIDESIRLHDKLLLVLSEASISSPWVEEEVEAALERERREKRLVLFPISIDDSVRTSTRAWASSLRRMRHIGDFKNWRTLSSYQVSIERLVRDLKATHQDISQITTEISEAIISSNPESKKDDFKEDERTSISNNLGARLELLESMLGAFISLEEEIIGIRKTLSTKKLRRNELSELIHSSNIKAKELCDRIHEETQTDKIGFWGFRKDLNTISHYFKICVDQILVEYAPDEEKTMAEKAKTPFLDELMQEIHVHIESCSVVSEIYKKVLENDINVLTNDEYKIFDLSWWLD